MAISFGALEWHDAWLSKTSKGLGVERKFGRVLNDQFSPLNEFEPFDTVRASISFSICSAIEDSLLT